MKQPGESEALRDAEAEAARLREERDAAIAAMNGTSDSRDDWRRWATEQRDRADSLSARCARLQQALLAVKYHPDTPERIRRFVTEALAGPGSEHGRGVALIGARHRLTEALSRLWNQHA